MIKGLQAIINRHFQDNSSLRPTKNMLEMIVTCSRGDIRGAVMELQLSALSNKKPTKGRKSGSNDAVTLLKLASQREQSLALFHLIGKVLYNKRMLHFLFKASTLRWVSVGKGDPPSSSATRREKEQLRLLERSIPDPEELSPHLKPHNRKASLVDVNVGSPIVPMVCAGLKIFGRRFMQTLRSTRLYFPYTCTRITLNFVISLKSAPPLGNG